MAYLSSGDPQEMKISEYLSLLDNNQGLESVSG